MNYQEMKVSHEAQIEALLVNDYDTLYNILRVQSRYETWAGHQDVWGNTGDVCHSLFGSLPGLSYCLTLIKDSLQTNSCVVTPLMRAWGQEFGILDNNLIPQNVKEDTVFTREQLEEFSRLQLLAHFPEGDVT